MQGIYIDGYRPKSKKQVKEAAATDASRVSLEATSIFGNESEGPLTDVPDGEYYFVGPCPYTRRSFYGTITVREGKVTVK